MVLPAVTAQNKMRPLTELINKESDTWDLVQGWIKNAKNVVQVLPKDSAKADEELYKTQVTTRSPMGTVIHETGGILVDNGWIRILGSGSSQLNRSVMEWNKGKSYQQQGEQPSFLLIADDVIGGFYAINAGGLDLTGKGKVFYYGPDDIKWVNTDMSYSDFLNFCFSGNLKEYYRGLRWTNWKKDVAETDGDSGFVFYPFLWSKEGKKDINKNSRKKVTISEIWALNFNKPDK